MATASHLVWFAHAHSPSRDRPPPASASGGRGLRGCLPSCATKSSRTLSTLGGGEGEARLEDIQVRFENIKKQKNEEDNPERAQSLPPTFDEFLIGSDSSRQDQEGQKKKKGLQEEVEANPGSTIPPGRRTDRPSPPGTSSFAAGPLLLAAGASLPPPPPPQAEWGAMGKVEGWLGGGGAKPRAAVQLPEDSAESSATRVDVDVGSGSEETAEHAAAAKIQDAWRRSPQRIRPEDSASNVGSALSQHTAKSGPGSAQGARLGFVLAAWGVAAAATAVKAAVSKARAAARPPKVRYQRHCFAPKFADRLNAPTVCVRVPEQIVIDLRADPKVMQVPTLEIQQPSPRPPKALAPSK